MSKKIALLLLSNIIAGVVIAMIIKGIIMISFILGHSQNSGEMWTVGCKVAASALPIMQVYLLVSLPSSR